MILWLDDLRPPSRYGYTGACWVKTAPDAIAVLKDGNVRFASLDHDLSIDATLGFPVPVEETGYSVVLWLEEHPQFWPPEGVAVHSLNPSGKQKMLLTVNRYYGRTFQSVNRPR